MLIPFIMDSESVSGFTMRRASLLLDRSIASMARRNLGVSRLLVGLPAGNLAQLALETAGVLGSVDDIVDQHTTIPAAMHLMLPQPDRHHILARIRRGACFDRELSYAALGKGLYRTRLGGAYCQRCACDDEAKFGFPYWRIEWEYTGVGACPIHRVSLTRGCGRCRESQAFNELIRSPSAECFCGSLAKPLLPESSSELETHIRIATLLTLARRSNRYYADECYLGALFRQRARDLGFRRGARLDRASLFEQFRFRYGDKLLNDLGLKGAGGPPSFVHSLSEGAKQAGVLRVAYLIDFLWESFEQFEESVSAFALAGEETKCRLRSPRGQAYSSEKLESATARVREYVRGNPDATRSQLLAKCSYAACYLMLHDRKTYEAVAPPSRRRTGYAAGRSSRMAQLDDVLAEYVQMRCETLRSGPEQEWRRLSVRTLLLGHPAERTFYTLKSDLPKTSALITGIQNDPRWTGK
ncbi:TniQ family protein [Paraburkholderia phytofirmans]|uniref:TniQ family protein n=1 Tax=Paraburkholderia phytofirmans TaxID=261302 RepID=UPI0011DFCD8A